jgi:WD40 repeat protein
MPDDDDDDDNDNDETSSRRQQELQQPVVSFYPPFDSTERKASNAFCLDAAIVKLATPTNETSYSIVCGGNDGSLYVQPLQVQRKTYSDSPTTTFSSSSSLSTIELSLTRPLFSLRPFHTGAVMAVTSPTNAPGLVATASQDGTLRMYEVGLRADESRCLYQFAGYKVWVGSLCVADGNKLFTDGADNTVIMHDFKKGKKKEE